MLISYDEFNPDNKEKIFENFSTKDKKEIINYLDYRKSRGLNSIEKLGDIRTGTIRLYAVAEKSSSKLNYKESLKLSSLIKESKFGETTKNEHLVNLKRILKWGNKIISSNEIEDIKLIKKPVSKKIINQSDLLGKDKVEKLISHEPKMFWKAFTITQYEAGLRTKENRTLEWDNVKFNVDGDLTELTIFSTKTKEKRTVFVKEATFYLKKLREEQENLGIKGKYIFHSPRDNNKPIGKANISMWMRRLSKRVLGKEYHNYILRHSRGNELYQLSKKNLISKETALAFMGHSERMSRVYTHDKSEEIKQMLKDQIYNIEELPPKEKNELQNEIAGLKEENRKIKEIVGTNIKETRVLLEKVFDDIRKKYPNVKI